MRKFTPKDVEEVHRLILASFHEFVAKSCSPRGISEFEKFQSPQNLLERAKTCEIIVAEEEGRIVGVVGRKEDLIFTLFVEKASHGKGIASRLLKKTEDNALAEGCTKLRVRSSLYAQGFYQKQGYKKSRGAITTRGITFQPMIKAFLK